MAQILLINEKTKKDWNNIGDVVVIFDDTVIPTEKEKEGFTIVHVPGTAEEIRAQMMEKIPSISLAWKDEIIGEWKELKEEPAYQCRYEAGVFSHNFNIKNSTPLSVKITNKINEVK